MCVERFQKACSDGCHCSLSFLLPLYNLENFSFQKILGNFLYAKHHATSIWWFLSSIALLVIHFHQTESKHALRCDKICGGR